MNRKPTNLGGRKRVQKTNPQKLTASHTSNPNPENQILKIAEILLIFPINIRVEANTATQALI